LLAAITCAGIAWNKFKGKKSWKNLAIVLAIVIVLFLAVIFLLDSNLWASVVSAIVSAVLLAWFFCRDSIKKLVQKTGVHRKQ
jgi:O-antigen/teichoic acid export membrane protein